MRFTISRKLGLSQLRGRTSSIAGAILCSCIPLFAQVIPAVQVDRSEREAHWVIDQIVHDPGVFEEQVGALSSALILSGALISVREDNDGETPSIRFKQNKALPAEGYVIEPCASGLLVQARDSRGAAFAAATLIQTAKVKSDHAKWPKLRMEDHPDLPYRSFMVDMGRNPHSPQTLLQIVDMMWMFKANYLHLHLSDDQLISWPSKAFPKIYSQRAGWTREDFEALEAYSQARGVTIVPELEVPGHSTILRREYPEVFGKTTTDLASSPKAQRGVETLIQEMLSVFKATPYFHIGGDEAYGVPEDTQRALINRLNKFVKQQGKQTLVWEGPHEGKGTFKVDKDVVHMNWRCTEFPAQAMLEAGHKIINASWDPLYIVDHYPRTMFTAVDVERCYAFDLQRFAHINHQFATFKKPHRTNTAQGILGFCMPWWEGREENLLPLCLPRLAAVSAAAWNRSGESNFADFHSRYRKVLELLKAQSAITLPEIPFAAEDTQNMNLAFRATVTSSAGSSQPHFGPERLTNGIIQRFDHFLGFPTQPEPLEITLTLKATSDIGRIVVHETAVGKSHELYELLVSDASGVFEVVGRSTAGARGEKSFIEHKFPPRKVARIRIRTQGCHGLTFPSFSRLTEVTAFDQ